MGLAAKPVGAPGTSTVPKEIIAGGSGSAVELTGTPVGAPGTATLPDEIIPLAIVGADGTLGSDPAVEPFGFKDVLADPEGPMLVGAGIAGPVCDRFAPRLELFAPSCSRSWCHL